MNGKMMVWTGLLLVLGIVSPIQAQGPDDYKKFPEYKPVDGVSGELKSIGSDTMNNLMTYWAEGFKKHYPNVKIEIEGKGSGTAPPALVAGSAQFGPMSRPMTEKEIDSFEKKFGYKPTAIASSIDMLAVFVNKDNPIKSLTLQQLDGIFGKNPRGNDIKNWGEVGLDGAFKNEPISLYGRNSASGTYAYFKEHILNKGDYKDTVKEQPGSSAVVQSVGKEKFAIGYSGIGYKNADVRTVPLAKDAKSDPVDTDPAKAYTGQYPLARALLIYVNLKSGDNLDPLRREFLRYVLSKEGQEVVIKDGYLPITANQRTRALKALGLTD
jgi:phosphate transport system substrate-binding protein